MDMEAWRAAVHGVTELDMTEQLNWTELKGKMSQWRDKIGKLCQNVYIGIHCSLLGMHFIKNNNNNVHIPMEVQNLRADAFKREQTLK